VIYGFAPHHYDSSRVHVWLILVKGIFALSGGGFLFFKYPNVSIPNGPEHHKHCLGIINYYYYYVICKVLAAVVQFEITKQVSKCVLHSQQVTYMASLLALPLSIIQNCQHTTTRSSAVAEAARASYLYSFNTKRRAQSFIISCFGFRYTQCLQIRISVIQISGFIR